MQTKHLILLLLAAPLLPAQAANYTLTALPGVPGSEWTTITNNGLIGGNAAYNAPALLRNHTTIEALPPGDFGWDLKSFSTVNNAGHSVIRTINLDSEWGPSQAYYYDGNGWANLGMLGGSYDRSAAANGINDRDQIIGNSTVDEGYVHGDRWASYNHAFLYEHGHMRDLGTLGGKESIARDINSWGQVVGVANDSKGQWRSFVELDGDMHVLNAPDGFQAAALNDAGQIAGNIGERAFVYWGGSLTGITVAGFSGADVSKINNAGQVVGTTRGGFYPRAYLYSDGQGTLLDDLAPGSGWKFYSVYDINDRGEILASGCKGSDCKTVLLTPDSLPPLLPVPEPQSWTMLAGGLGLMGALLRRRRRGGARRA
jgi:probable HAF family extracellular repeat protein